MSTLAVIPARMESSRFFGKPLAKICGIPMIAHCYERALLCPEIDHAVVATPNAEIMDYCRKNNIESIFTSPNHQRATERAQEVLNILDPKRQKIKKIILIQGDEPQTNPQDCSKLLDSLNDQQSVCNLVFEIDKEHASDKNIVKAVIASNDEILFFSRSPVPHNGEHYFRQLGLIAFTAESLDQYTSLVPTSLEVIESIDMMRFLENKVSITAVFSSTNIIGVDLAEHISLVEKQFQNDKFIDLYQTKYA